MMRSVRKNFFNLVIICDPSKAKCRPLIKMLESFYLHRAPTRIGIIFAVNPDLDEATGQNDAGVAMLNAYNYVHDQSSSTDGLAFITSCYNKVSDIEFCLDSWQNIAGFLCLFGNFVDFL